jgi:prepilin-type processing-associated H-X9-DG protein
MSGTGLTSKRSGYTLVELVVVTALCGLLIAMMLPPMQQARNQAWHMVCAGNLHQQYQAATAYSVDNVGYYPRGAQGLFSGDEYNIYATALLPYLGWDGAGPLWPNFGQPGYRTMYKQLNRILLDFDVFHCPGFPADFYDDPNDRRFFYTSAVDEELYGPGGVNPLHYVVSAFGMPYTQYAINHAGNPCWDPNGDATGFGVPSGAGIYVDVSRLDEFPENCPPATKVYVTGVDKTAPWISDSPNSRTVIGVRYHSVFTASQLGFSSEGRIGEERRHPRGMNCLFFDGHVRQIATDTLDPGCDTTLDYRLRFFTIPWEGWDGWENP